MEFGTMVVLNDKPYLEIECNWKIYLEMKCHWRIYLSTSRRSRKKNKLSLSRDNGKCSSNLRKERKEKTYLEWYWDSLQLDIYACNVSLFALF